LSYVREGNRLKNFDSLELFEPLNRALAEQKYEHPTPIQSKTIPAALEGHDILGCAQTGPGKTAAFALPILDFIGQEKLEADPKRPLALILAPTRELAIQIDDSFGRYGKHMRVRRALVYGGVGQLKQVNSLRKGPHVLVATPGRLLDLMNQKHVDLGDVEILVLDEADRMLDMGFLPDLKRIIAKVPDDRQSLFFSATMPPKISELAAAMLSKPVRVDVTPKETSVKSIDQQVYMVERSRKLACLRELLNGDKVESVIVFTKTKRGANNLCRRLESTGIQCAVIHGNKSQNARQNALDSFRKKQVKALVATDVAARGLDIERVTHVVNYDMPIEAESYVHRVGRTGRAGADGIAISLCTVDELDELRAIEKLLGKPLRTVDPDGLLKNARTATPRKSPGTGANRSGKPTRKRKSAVGNQSKQSKHRKTKSGGKSRYGGKKNSSGSRRSATAT
jgi:ATP-dependent RNA helicase RhlE